MSYITSGGRGSSGIKKSKKAASLEADIEKARLGKDWESALKLAGSYSKLSNETGWDPLLELILTGEHFIETGNASEGKLLLSKALEKSPEDEEALALMGKAELEAGNKENAFQILRKMTAHKSMKSLSNQYTLHQARLIMEMLYKRGFQCFEALKDTKSAIESYQEVIDFAVKYFHGSAPIDKESVQWIEKSLSRIPAVHWKNGDMPACIEALRFSLSTPFDIKGDTYRSFLANVLLKKTTSVEYPKMVSENNNIYVPKDEVEESILLSLMYEESTSASDTFAEKKEDQLTLYDDITLEYSKRYGYSNIIAILEKLISTRYDNLHFWYQFALALLSAKKYKRALFALEHCISLEPTDPYYYLLCAKIHVNHMQLPQAVTYAQTAVDLCKNAVPSNINYVALQSILPKCYHTLGLAYSKLSREAVSSEDKIPLQKQAIEQLTAAYNLDKNDYLINFHLALQYAEIREIPKAVFFVSDALSKNRAHAESWILSALLLTSQKQYEQALSCCKLALKEVNDINLLITKAKIEQHLGDYSKALQTYKEAFLFVKHQQDSQTEKEGDSERNDISDHKSVESSVKDFETDSVDKRSYIYTHTMSVYSDSLVDKTEEQEETAVGRTDLWLHSAELFALLGQFQDSYNCMHEAKVMANFSPDIFYQEGKVEEIRQHDKEAIALYEKALAIEASHVNSLVRLGSLYQKLGPLSLAERYLNTAVRKDHTNHEAWNCLGKVFSSKGDQVKASECFLTAAQLEETNPLVNFSKIKKHL